MLTMRPLDHGKLAPQFSLQGTDGKTYQREAFRGKKGLLLVFFDDPARVDRLLADIGKDKSEYDELGAVVLGISPRGLDELRAAQDANQLPFALLTDPDGTAWAQYTHTDARAYGYGAFVLDMYGGVDNQQVVAEAAELPDAGTLLGWMQGAQYRCNI
jgi:peroxiredoxin